MTEKNEQREKPLKQTADIESTMLSSKDGTHRYLLTRSWDRLLPKLLVVMIRPGYSGLVTTDTSTSLCVQNAVALGFGSLAIGNIFSKLNLDGQNFGEDATNEENDRQLMVAAALADKVVVATGRKNSAVIDKRRAEVLELLRPQAAKLCEIADAKGRQGFHPLSPSCRYHWTLVPLSADRPEDIQSGKKHEAPEKPKAKE